MDQLSPYTKNQAQVTSEKEEVCGKRLTPDVQTVRSKTGKFVTVERDNLLLAQCERQPDPRDQPLGWQKGVQMGVQRRRAFSSEFT